VAVADVGREGERYLGEIDSSSATVEKLIGKLTDRYEKRRVCYEAGPTEVWVVPPGSRLGPRMYRQPTSVM
jgi:hypothetical protein